MSSPPGVIRSALRQSSDSKLAHPHASIEPSALSSSSKDSPVVAETEAPTLQQLREMRAEAEESMKQQQEQMTSLNKQIDRAMQGFFPKTATLAVFPPNDEDAEDVGDSISAAGSEDMGKKDSNRSRVSTLSKAVSFTPSLEEGFRNDDGDVTQPLLSRGRRSTLVPHSANASEIWDPKASQHLANLSADRNSAFHGELRRKLDRPPSYSSLISDTGSEVGEPMGKRNTIHMQGFYASKVSLSLRIFGLALAFITMVLLWEGMDLIMYTTFPNEEQVLIGYLVLAVLAAGCLALSQEMVSKAAEDLDQSSLPASFAYALSTLYLAIGTWGVIRASVNVLVAKKVRIFVYAAGGLITLIGTIMYGIQTRHNVLLDIASCSTSMGLHDDDLA